MKGLLAEDVKATPAVITTWDFRLRSSKMADRYSGEFQFTVSHQTTLHGFAVWFAIGFPGGVSVGCGPFEEYVYIHRASGCYQELDVGPYPGKGTAFPQGLINRV